jgi:hypothetical protein
VSVACYLEPTKPKADRWMQVFARGCNGRVIDNGILDVRADDHAVMGNWPVASRLIADFARSGAAFWYLDSAYIRGPGGNASLRVERNRFWPELSEGTHTLERALSIGVQIQPWRHAGRSILVAQHGPKFGLPWSIDIGAWHATIVDRIRAVTDRPIVVRPKPYSPEAIRLAPPLEEQLADAWCVVTHSSTIGVMAALAGVPVFCEPTCAAAPVACTDFSKIEAPLRPEREGWLAELAWRQWSKAEMRSGEAWAHIKQEDPSC